MTKTVDPFAGSYVVESMTDDLEAAIRELMQAVDDHGGAVAAIEQGFQKSRDRASAYSIAQQIDERRAGRGRRQPLHHLGRRDRTSRCGSTRRSRPSRPSGWPRLRADRDEAAVDPALTALQDAAAGPDNVLYPMREALRARATVGEVCHALREVWGIYVPRDAF